MRPIKFFKLKNKKEVSKSNSAKMTSVKIFPYSDKRHDKRLVEMDKDEDGKPFITERYLKELCEKNG